MKQLNALVWYRLDLRVHDHEPLARAQQVGARTHAICVVTKADTEAYGQKRNAFMAKVLAELAKQLAEVGALLSVVRVDNDAACVAAVADFCKANHIGHLFYHRQLSKADGALEVQVERAVKQHKVTCEAFDDQCIVSPKDLRTLSGAPYQVFTPFKRAFVDAVVGEMWEKRDLQVPVNKSEALQVMDAFLDERVKDYQRLRDFPAENGTSGLSPYLALGALSIRQCFGAALRHNNGSLIYGDEGLVTWINELIWREFYRHVWVNFDWVQEGQPFKAIRPIAWKSNPSDFERWCDGQTGFPLIDAAMRCLVQTGHMHNRLRMVVASFLTKNLLIDWRLGEVFFMRHLLDADRPSNNGGWQWAASVGTDAQPYFRIFNPVSQSQKFDPEGRFIREYCPELKSLSKKAIHDPSHNLTATQLAVLGYPLAMCDLSYTRERALAAYGRG